MIAIVRLRSQTKEEKIWNYIIEHKDELQASIKDKGRLLYLSRREKHEDSSLFIHVSDTNVLSDLIANRLSKIEDATGIWVINMLRPIFFSLPKDTSNMERFTITLNVFPEHLSEIYENLSSSTLPDGLLMAYIAFTYHLFGDCIQFSILADREEALNKYLTEAVKNMPGVLRATVSRVRRTVPLLSYDEWKQYSTEHSIVPDWHENDLVGQFQSWRYK